MIRLSVINFISSFQNVSDGLPIQPCGFFLPREKNGKTSWVRPELVPKISFLFGGKKVFYFWKKRNTLGKNEILWGKTKMKIWPKIFPVKTQGMKK